MNGSWKQSISIVIIRHCLGPSPARSLALPFLLILMGPTALPKLIMTILPYSRPARLRWKRETVRRFNFRRRQLMGSKEGREKLWHFHRLRFKEKFVRFR